MNDDKIDEVLFKEGFSQAIEVNVDNLEVPSGDANGDQNNNEESNSNKSNSGVSHRQSAKKKPEKKKKCLFFKKL